MKTEPAFVFRRPAWLSGRWGYAWWAAAGLVLFHLGWTIFHWGGQQNAPLISSILFWSVGLFAIAGAWRAARRLELDRGLRRAWFMVGLALALQFTGDVVYYYLEGVLHLAPEALFPSLADAFYLSTYPLFFAAVWSFPVQSQTLLKRLQSILSLAMIAIIAWITVWHFLIVPSAADATGSVLAQIVSAASPIGDVVLLISLFSLLLSRPQPAVSQAVGWLALAITAFIFSDLAYIAASLSGAYLTGSLIDNGWIIAYLCFASAALAQTQPMDETHGADWFRRLSLRVQPIVPFAATGLAFGVVGWEFWRTGAAPLDLLIGAGLVSLLMAAPHNLALRENQAAFQELQAQFEGSRRLTIDLEHQAAQQATELAEIAHELSTAHERLQSQSALADYRARQLAASAEVTQNIAALHSSGQLLETTVELIASGFSFYHVAIYLISEAGDWAVLSAASSPGGQRLLARGRRLRLGPQNLTDLVSQVAYTRRARVALEAAHFDAPELPDTRSQLAAPMRVRDRILGVLDVQAANANAFSQEDAQIFQTLADQIAGAIDGARVYEAQAASLAELRALQQQTRQALGVFDVEAGFRYDGLEVRALTEANQPTDASTDLRLPINIAGVTLGEIQIQRPDAPWTDEDRLVAEAVTERLGLTLENARLFETTRASLADASRLYQASRAINAGRTQDEILRAVVEYGLAPHYARFAIGLAETDGWQRLTKLRLAVIWDARHGLQFPDDLLMTAAELPPLAEAQLGQPISLTLAEADPQTQIFLRTRGLRAGALLSFGIGDKLTGVALVGTAQTYAFAPEELRSLQSLVDQAAVAIENIRLLEETQRRVSELATLNTIGQVLAGQSDLNALLVQTGENIVSAFGVTDGYIALHDPATDLIEAPFFIEQGQRQQLEPVPLGQGLASVIIRTRQHLLLNHDAMRQAEAMGAKLVGRPTLSFLGVPIMAGDQAIGVINIQSAEREGLFGESDVNLLTTIAASVSAAIQNARLLAETQRRAQQLATAAEVSRAAISQLNQDDLIREAVELIRARFDLYYAAIFIVDAAGEWAVLRHATGQAGQTLLARQHRLEVGGQSMVGTAISRRQARVALDVGAEKMRFANPLLPDTRSEMALPLAVGDTVLGALDVQSVRPAAFGPADINVLQTMADQMATALQNARLFAEARQRLAELGLLNRVGLALTRQLDLRLQLNEVGELLLSYFRVPNGYLALYNRATNLIEIPFFQEGPERHSIEPFPLGEGVSSAIIRSRLPLLINQDAELRLQELGAKIVGKPAKSFLGVPIIVGNDVIGVINVQSTEHEGLFSQTDVNLLITIAASVGSAIQTARLFAETQQRAQQLATAAEVGRAATSTLNVEELLRQSVELIRERFRLYHAALYIVEPDSEIAVLRAATGEAGRLLLTRQHQLEIGSRSLVGAATFTRQPVVVQDIARDETHYRQPLLPDTRAQAVLPLLAGDLVVGALDVHHQTPGAFSETDLTVLRTIADQLASAVQNGRLFDSARRLANREQTLNRISGKLRGLLDISTIAQTAVTELGRALGARRAVLHLGAEDQLLPPAEPPAGSNGHGPNGHGSNGQGGQ